MKKCCARRCGVITILAALLLVLMLAMVAFAIDVGWLSLVRAELACAADAGALAGAARLSSGATAAKDAAKQFAEMNRGGGELASVVVTEDVALGRWHKDTCTFEVLTGSGESKANAVRVTCRRSQARGNALPLFFGPVLGRSATDVSAEAVALGESINCGPFIGLDKVTMSSSSHTDSYDSDSGPYSAASAGNKGDVCSNGNITMSGSATIHGDAHPGVGKDVKTSGSASVTETTAARTEPLVLAPVDFGDVATNNQNGSVPLSALGKDPLDNSRVFKLSGSDSVTLPPGKYYFSKVDLSGSSSIVLTGATTIYCTGDFQSSGGTIVNPNQKPADFQIYCTGSTVDLSGSSVLYGVVYAPTSKITRSGESDYFGMLAGKELNLSGGGGIHYDTAIGTLNGIQPRPQLVK